MGGSASTEIGGVRVFKVPRMIRRDGFFKICAGNFPSFVLYMIYIYTLYIHYICCIIYLQYNIYKL